MGILRINGGRKGAMEHVPLVVFAMYVTIWVFDDYCKNSFIPLADPAFLGQMVDMAKCIVITAAILFIFCMGKRLPIWQVLVLLCVSCLFIISKGRSGSSKLGEDLLILLLVAGCDTKRICRTYGISCVAVVSFVMLLAVLGLVYNRDVVPNSRLVFAYGIGHPNTTGVMLFSALAAMAYAWWDKEVWPLIAVLSALAAAFSYNILSSNAATIMLIELAITVLVLHIFSSPLRRPMIQIAFRRIAIFLPVLLFAFFVLGIVYYRDGDSAWRAIDGILHGRIWYAQQYYDNNGGLTLFGREWASIPSYYHTGLPFANLDGGYAHLALVHGMVSASALYVLFIITVVRLRKNLYSNFISILFILSSVHMLMEVHGLGLYSCSTLAFLSLALVPRRNDADSHLQLGMACRV